MNFQEEFDLLIHDYSLGKISSEPIVSLMLNNVSNNKEYFVFVVPVNKTLDLKKASKATNSKSIEMIPQKQLLPLTGYIHGGCSPIGLKKPFLVTIDSSAKNFSSLIFSGGKIGYQVEMSLDELKKVIKFELKELVFQA